jgi:YHYH protein
VPHRTIITIRHIALAMSSIMTVACAGKMTPAVPASNAAIIAFTETAMQTAKWGTNVSVSFANGMMRYRSNGVPNHPRQTEYALPRPGSPPGRLSEATAYASADPTRERSYDFQISLTPTKAAQSTPTNLGTIGVMISGAALFNPYEGDGTTVAMSSNFTVPNAAGKRIAFLDSCNGHPTPMGDYHYHALPPCVTSMVDVVGGPSHIIGVAFDGYPIYGDRDMSGAQITASQLDKCSGMTSVTPEFPRGVYHYVLLSSADATSSIRCFTGNVTMARRRMPGMMHP